MNTDKQLVPIIDTYRCNGCGSCVELCPQVFAMDETAEVAVVHLADDLSTLPDCVHEAISWCPISCIELEE